MGRGYGVTPGGVPPHPHRLTLLRGGVWPWPGGVGLGSWSVGLGLCRLSVGPGPGVVAGYCGRSDHGTRTGGCFRFTGGGISSSPGSGCESTTSGASVGMVSIGMR